MLTTLEIARGLDEKDPLKDQRTNFFQVDQAIYMDGNSLGLASLDAKKAILGALEDWQTQGIKIWGIKDGKYYHYPRLLGARMSRLIGARSEEVIAMGSITSNIHQVLSTLYKPTAKRYKILVDSLNFPTDIYAVESIIKLKGLQSKDALVHVPSTDQRTLDTKTICDYLTQDVAIALLPAVLYRSAQLMDLETITLFAHQQGILIGWDLAHGIGAVPFDFESTRPDFAVWCTYKYLNAGPGAVAGLYLNRRHFKLSAGLSGWFGNQTKTQFALKQTFEQADDAGGLLQGTPHILSMAGLEGALIPFEKIGIEPLRKKSIAMTEFLIQSIDKDLEGLGFEIGSPRKSQERGGHIALEHPEAYRISQALRDHGVLPDYREPNVIRLAPMALYNTFEEIALVIQRIKEITLNKRYEDYPLERETVI